MLIFCIFEIFCIFFVFFEIIWKCVSHDADGRTDTEGEKENYFGIYLENKCHTVWATGQTK